MAEPPQRAFRAADRAPAANVIGLGIADVLRSAPRDLLPVQRPAIGICLIGRIVVQEPRAVSRGQCNRFETAAGMFGQERAEPVAQAFLITDRQKQTGQVLVAVEHIEDRVIGGGLRSVQPEFARGLAIDRQRDGARRRIARQFAFEQEWQCHVRSRERVAAGKRRSIDDHIIAQRRCDPVQPHTDRRTIGEVCAPGDVVAGRGIGLAIDGDADHAGRCDVQRRERYRCRTGHIQRACHAGRDARAVGQIADERGSGRKAQHIGAAPEIDIALDPRRTSQFQPVAADTEGDIARLDRIARQRIAIVAAAKCDVTRHASVAQVEQIIAAAEPDIAFDRRSRLAFCGHELANLGATSIGRQVDGQRAIRFGGRTRRADRACIFDQIHRTRHVVNRNRGASGTGCRTDRAAVGDAVDRRSAIDDDCARDMVRRRPAGCRNGARIDDGRSNRSAAEHQCGSIGTASGGNRTIEGDPTRQIDAAALAADCGADGVDPVIDARALHAAAHDQAVARAADRADRQVLGRRSDL